MKTSRPALLVLLAVVTLVLAACQQAATGLKPEVVPGGVIGEQGRDVDGGAVPPIPGDDGANFGGGEESAGEADRSIIRTGEITIEVENVPETVGEVRALAVELDGFISNSFQGEIEDMATLTMRIPADRFDNAIAAIHDLDGEVKAEATNEQDVTAVVIDIEARLENLRAAEVEYRELLDRAETVEDILAIQNQLFAVRGEIEAYEAQLEYYTDQVDLATLTVSIIPVPQPVEQASEDFDPAAIVQEALASLVSFGQWLVSAGIWLLIVGIPALIVFGIVAFVIWKVFQRLRPARSLQPPQAPSPEADASAG
ncbi:MAG TPA: DUF4349 domain-containing protein [Candidatus Limnocylindria bacterium]|nr:DUF4349 domain-containing protein [Candidatus Limnocylindria bacterium]